MFKSYFATNLVSLLGFAMCLPSVAAEELAVRYAIAIHDPAHHLAEVSATFPSVDTPGLELRLPAWRTGKYKILNFAAGVAGLRAVNADGRILPVSKTDKSTWWVALERPEIVTVNYQLYANKLSDRTRHIDETHAFFDAAATLVYAEQFRQLPTTVTLDVPSGWRSRSGLAYGQDRHRFVAGNYDVLVDSPIETGVHTFHQFVVDGRDYELVVWGQGNQDEVKLIADLSSISAAAGGMWGGYPFQRYVWMLHLTDGSSGATEHVNSTIIQVDRFKFSPREEYLAFLSTAAHEFIHTWNVKAYRPMGIATYDYQQENYTPLLWLVEGSTSYLSPLLLARAGVVDGKEFLDYWAKAVEAHLRRPGRLRQSPSAASFDAWLDESPQWDSNAKANIYAQGMIVSWLLDMTILRRTDLNMSYWDIHRLLYQRFPVATLGYEQKDVLDLLSQVSDMNMQNLWDMYILGNREVDVSSLLSDLGLRIQYGDPDSNDPALAWTGMTFGNDTGMARLTMVERGSPAWDAGMTEGDAIIALNGFQVDAETLPSRLKERSSGDRVELSFFRRGRLQLTTMIVGDSPGEPLQLVPVEVPSPTQIALFEAWSGMQWPYPETP